MAGGGPFTSATGLSGREVRPVGLSLMGTGWGGWAVGGGGLNGSLGGGVGLGGCTGKSCCTLLHVRLPDLAVESNS